MGEIRELLKRREEELTAFLHKTEAAYDEKNYPGRLRISNVGDRTRYYQIVRSPGQGQKDIYLSEKTQMDLIKGLAQKTYDSKILKELQNQLKAVQRALETIDEECLSEIYSSCSEERKKLIKPIIPDMEDYIREWEAVEFEPGDFSKVTSEIYTTRMERVRSKIEKIIADRYCMLKIPYRYEWPITVMHNGRKIVLRPDFTVLNRRTGKLYYHEHLGMMGDPGYCDRNINKIHIYEENGMYAGETMLYTMETANVPFSTKSLDAMIERYLL